MMKHLHWLLVAASLAGCMGTEPDKPKPKLQALSSAGSDFGQTRTGTSKLLEFALSNSDAGFVSVETLKDISISASGDGVTMTHTCPNSLDAGQSCLISVVYQPSVTGTLAGRLSITSNAETSPLVNGLSGTAVDVLDPAQGAVVFSGSTATDFTVAAGQSVSRTYTVSNIGNATDTLTITGPGANDTGWTFVNNCAATLAAGANCTLTLSYAPSATGSSVPTAIVVSDAYNQAYGTLTLQPVGIAQ